MKVDTLAPPVRPDSPQGDPATCAIKPGRETIIEIQKGKSGLGLSIVGGADTLLGAIIVHEVYEDGAAAKDGRLWAGDQIIDVRTMIRKAFYPACSLQKEFQLTCKYSK